MRLVDVVVAFPFIVLVIALVFVLGPGQRSIVIAITMVGWVSYARIVRGEILVQKRLEYVLAARAAGLSDAPHHPPPPAAQRDHAGDRLLDERHRAVRARDRHAQLPRRGHPAADRRLGIDDRRRPVADHVAVADRHVPGHRRSCSPASACPCSATASRSCWLPSDASPIRSSPCATCASRSRRRAASSRPSTASASTSRAAARSASSASRAAARA